MREEFDHMLSNWFDGGGHEMAATYMPSFDLTETDSHYQVHADLPGIQANELKVQVSDNVLTISGERKFEKNEGGEKDKKNAARPHFVERYHGSFSRSIVLPGNVKQDKIDAQYRDGVLTVMLPKAAECKPCQIEVKT